MDVDVPERRIDSIKDFLLHIGTVTVGILIALGLEGGREWVHERNLVHEARANMMSELRDNQHQLAETLQKVPRTRREIRDVLDVLDKLARTKPGESIKVHFSVGFSDASLLGVNRSTAETTGALGHMSYGELRKYAVIYESQQQYLRAQERFHDQLMVFMAAMQSGRSGLPTSAELDGTRQGVLLLLALLNATEQAGNQLAHAYRENLR
jgi:hypothetical protein